MKKRAIAMVVAFVLVFSLFAWLGVYSGAGDSNGIANAALPKTTGMYSVVEIVPDYSYAQFANAAGGSIQVGYEQVKELDEDGNETGNMIDKIVGGKKVLTGVVTGTCTLNGVAASVITYTPKELNSDVASVWSNIRTADFFVINNTAGTTDAQFNNTTGGTGYSSFLDAGADISWKAAYEILKNVAGAYSDNPARYIIDKSVYDDNDGSTLAAYGYDGPGLAYNQFLSVVSSQTVYAANITKLYMMLELMDPGTFYGVYLASHAYDYGIDEKTGELIGYGIIEGKGAPEEAGARYSAWNPNLLLPRFAGSSFSNTGINTSLNTALTSTNYKRGFSFTGSVASQYASISGSITTALGKSYTLDRKQYRILAVDPNNSSDVDESLILDFMNYGNSNSISFIGGISVDNMSMYQFVGDVSDLEEKYDLIYLGAGADNANGSTRSKLYGAGLTSQGGNARKVNGVSAANQYLTQKYLTLGQGNSKLVSLNTVKDYSAKLTWNAGTTVAFPSLDLTTGKKTELTQFLSSKKIYYSSSLSSNCDNGSIMKSFLGTSSSNLVSGVPTVANIRAGVNKFSVDVVNWPVLYKSIYTFDYQNENYDYVDYLLEDDNSKVQRYVNSVKNAAGDYVYDSSANPNRKLDFGFYISDATGSSNTYTLNLYVDQNNDGRFNEAPVQTKTGVGKGYDTWSATPVAPNYVGGVYWKFEIVSSNGQKVSKTGVSAYMKAPGAPAKTINILQIIPDDTITDWTQSQPSEYVWVPTSDTYNDKGSAKIITQSTATGLILPTKSEIGSLNIANKALNGKTNIQAVEEAFNSKMNVQIRSVHDVGGVAQFYYYNNLIKLNQDNADRADALLANTGLFYYFMSKTGDYDINVKRYSVNQFETAVNNGDVVQLANGKIQYANPDPASSGGDITCDLLMIGMGRGLTPFNSITYSPGKKTALEILRDYIITNELPTYIGGGVMKHDSSDEITVLLREYLGQDRFGAVDNLTATGSARKTGIHGYTYDGNTEHSTPDNGKMIRTNTSAITCYPYEVPYFDRCTDLRQQPFQLALDDSDDITVLFSIYGGNGAGGLGDTINSYYMYKKGNLTYCSMGFSDRKRGGKLSPILKLPEAALIVNSIIQSTNTIPGPNPDDDETPNIPNIVITNPDKDEYSTTINPKNADDTPNMEAIPLIKDDSDKQPTDPSVKRAGYTKKTDYFYPDFDFDDAKSTNSATVGVDLSANAKNSYIYNVPGVGPVLKIAFTKSGTDDAKLQVKAGTTVLDIDVKYYSGNTATVSPDNAINTAGTTYFVEIPLNSAYYASAGVTNATSYGIDRNENFSIVLETIPDGYKYGAKTDVNIVKRGLFTIH